MKGAMVGSRRFMLDRWEAVVPRLLNSQKLQTRFQISTCGVGKRIVAFDRLHANHRLDAVVLARLRSAVASASEYRS